MEKALKIISKWWVIPEIKTIPYFFNDPGYIDAFVKKGQAHDLTEYDHVIFSYHGLPERQIDKVHPSLKCSDCNCDKDFNKEQMLCYRNQCYETSRLIAISEDGYTVAFQSRLGKTPWLSPYSDQVIEEYAKKGMKKLLVYSPAFVADCLETSIEIGDEYQEIFKEHGGEKVQLVESLNDSSYWIDSCERIIKNALR